MKVRGLGEEIYFDEISITKSANCHSVCNFKQRVAEENISVYKNAVGKKISVELEGGRPIFFGEVVETVIEKTFRGSYAEIKAVSNSCKVDETPETRIFQNPEKKFAEMLNPSRLNVSDCKIELDEKFSAKTCAEIILQDNETAFEFMNRIAAWQSQRLWIIDTAENACKIKISSCADDSANKISADDELRLKIGRRGKLNIANLTSAKYFELGHILNFEDSLQRFLIVALKVYQENGVDRIDYELEEVKDISPSELADSGIKKLSAKVVQIKDDKNFGRVQVQFDIEDKDSKKTWLAYRSPYSGIIFLPEVGDSVEIFYSGGDCFVNSILRTATLDAEVAKVEEKFIGNNRKQRILFREKSLELKSAETLIFMDDKKIILSVGNNKITLDEGGITLKTDGELKSEIAKNFSEKIGGEFKADVAKNFSVKVGGDFISETARDISLKSGGKFTAKASGAAQIGGSSVELG